MNELKSDNEVKVLAIIEASSTTMPVPDGKKITMDEYKRIRLEEA